MPARKTAKSKLAPAKAKAKAKTKTKAKASIRLSPGDPLDEADEFSARGGLPFTANRFPQGLDGSSTAHAAKELTWAAFDDAVKSLAQSAKAYRPQVVVGLVHGGVFVGGAVASLLKANFFPVRITARSRDQNNQKVVSTDMPSEVKGKRVLLVDDVAGSGDSLDFACRLAKAAGAKQLKTMALVSRPSGYVPDYSAIVGRDLLIFPWDYQTVTNDTRFDPDTAGA